MDSYEQADVLLEVIKTLNTEVARLRPFESFKWKYENEKARHEETKTKLLEKNTITNID